MEGIHEAASQPGGTSADVWSGLGPVPAPGLRQDRHRRAHRQGRPVLVHVLHRRPQAPDRDRRDRRAGRLRRRNRGADRAADGLASGSASPRSSSPGPRRRFEPARARSRQPDQARRAGSGRRRAAHAAPAARPAADARRARPGDLLGRDARRRHARTWSPANPHYYVDRQADLPDRRRPADARALARRLRAPAPAEKRHLRAADLQHPGGARRSATPPAAPSARSTCRSSPSRPPSSARCC